MTISSTIRKAGPFPGNGFTVALPFTFKVFTAADVLAVKAVTATGVETTLTLGSDYTVTLNEDQNTLPGGTLTLVTAHATGTTVTLTSQVANTQGTDLTNLGGFYPKVINDALDRATIQIQQLAEKVGRSLLSAVSSSSPARLPAPVPTKVLAWNSAGTDLENVDMIAGQSALADALASASGSSLVKHSNGETVADVLDGIDTIARSSAGAKSRPVYIEQNISGFFGRGMLTAETPNVITEQALTVNASAGSPTLNCTNVANFVVGGCVTIKHDNGKYRTYSVGGKSGNTIDIKPPLRHACTVANARIERTWYNRAHPGKFYMRELAQRVATSTEIEAAMPSGGRVLFTNVASNPNTLEDTLVAVGGTSVNYFDASHLGSAGTASPPRFMLGRAAFVDTIDAAGDGAETQVFPTNGVADAVIKVALHAEGGGHTYAIQALSETGALLAELVVPQLAATQIYTLGASLRGATGVKVRVCVKAYGSAGGAIAISQIDCFEAPATASKIIANPAAKFVCLGDSWIFGDPGAPVERASFTTHLAAELPHATLINAGIGGNKVWEMVARFDADVAVHNPDYVVINTGTNECYNPASGTFYPTAVQAFLDAYSQLLSKIASIGARAIIIGTPALAQSDEDVPAFPEWQLNDRAQIYARYFFEWQSTKPVIQFGSNANGRWVKYADGALECFHTLNVTTAAANTLASAAWTFPVSPIAAPTVQATCSGYDTGQLVSVGVNSTTASGTTARMMTGSSGVTLPVMLSMSGRWK